VDVQVTTHGLAGALSARTGRTMSVGLEFPRFQGRADPRPFVLAHIVL